jgi:hypothetical protein
MNGRVKSHNKYLEMQKEDVVSATVSVNKSPFFILLSFDAQGAGHTYETNIRRGCNILFFKECGRAGHTTKQNVMF